MYLSVIIPAYNEAKRIGKTLESVNEYISRQSYDYEIIVVNDGSKDNTKDIVNQKISEIKNLYLLDNSENHGKGWVVRQGLQRAKGELRLFMDADNSTTVDQIERMLPYIKKDYSIVIGSRRIKGADIALKQPLIRDLLGGVFRTVVRTIVPLGVKDSQAGFKLFTRGAVEALFSCQTVFRWAFDVEILAIAKLKKLKIKEVPIIWVNDLESHVKLGGMINMLLEIIKIRFNIWTGKYH